jgi:putative solute:sodium symporter small subunit
MDRKYIMTSFGYAIIGLVLGIYMAASKNHSHMVTHAHIMLVGFVVSFVYALCFKLWLNNSQSTLAKAQFYFHQIGSFGLLVSLFLLYGNYISLEILDPILAVASIAILISMILMKVLFIKTK